MKLLVPQELPNINDPELLRCCLAAGQARNSLVGLIRHAIGQMGEIPVTIPTRCALACLNRIAESALSTELLCQKNRVRDAAILILSIFELRLDLQYIALDTSRATTWIEHAEEKKKPWRVSTQLKAVYSDLGELEAQFYLYRQYSMVKHCNPMGRSLAFPLSVTTDTFTIDMASSNSQWIGVHMFALGTQICDAAKAASDIWVDQGFDVGLFVADMQERVEEIWRYREKQIISVLKGVFESNNVK